MGKQGTGGILTPPDLFSLHNTCLSLVTAVAVYDIRYISNTICSALKNESSGLAVFNRLSRNSVQHHYSSTSTHTSDI